MENSSKKRFVWEIIICVSVIVLLLVLDIVTKQVVYHHFNGIEGSEIEVIPNFFWIRLQLNMGAFFSMLSDAHVLLAILSVVGTIGSTFYLVKNFKKHNIWIRVCLYLFIPGCTGNLIDRVGLYGTGGGVIDFFAFRLFNVWDFAVFNVADICLTFSIFIFLIYSIFFDKSDKEKSSKNEEIEKILEEQEDLIKE